MGLVRREVDRVVSNASTQTASSGTTDTAGQLLAPEVSRLEFRYFDGSQWLTEWDSQQNGGLPLAVEITLGITVSAPGTSVAGPASAGATGSQAVGTNPVGTGETLYRLVVRLPVAEPITSTQASGTGLLSEGGLGL
jgi:hypothetical protein